MKEPMAGRWVRQGDEMVAVDFKPFSQVPRDVLASIAQRGCMCPSGAPIDVDFRRRYAAILLRERT